MDNVSPLIIGGVGGSGTRIYREISIVASYNMNALPFYLRPFYRTRISEIHDNFLLRKHFFGRWTDSYRSGEAHVIQTKIMQWQCRISMWLCGLGKGGRWGFKNPRTIYLIDFFKQMYPDMRFIHVIRDGRDHAFHPRFDYRRHQ